MKNLKTLTRIYEAKCATSNAKSLQIRLPQSDPSILVIRWLPEEALSLKPFCKVKGPPGGEPSRHHDYKACESF